VKLYHFTSQIHWAAIQNAGSLKTVESNISMLLEHAGPDVVWLTSNPDPAAHKGWAGLSFHDKTSVRITVNVPDDEVSHWPFWSRKHDIDEEWYDALATAGNPEEWWVIERPVTQEEWQTVTVDGITVKDRKAAGFGIGMEA
jgi:hypothetical protein